MSRNLRKNVTKGKAALKVKTNYRVGANYIWGSKLKRVKSLRWIIIIIILPLANFLLS